MLQVGLIGAGYFSRFHIDAWQRLHEVNLLAIAETDESRREILASELPEIKLYGSAEDLLSENQLDILDIATPPSAHRTILRDAVNGVKMIVCQKPFCVSLSEAEEIAEMVKGSKSTLVIHENFRFQPWYRKIKSIICSGELGEVLQAQFRLRPGDGAGVDAYFDRQPYFRNMKRFLIHETGIHWIDVFRFLFGIPQTIYGDLRRLNPEISGEDAGYFIFGYADGQRAVFDGNRLLDHSADNHRLTMGEFVVEGTKATITLNGDAELFLRNRGEKEGQKIDYDIGLKGFGGDCVFNFQKHIADFCLGRGELENSVENYLPNLVLENLIYESALTGRRCRVEM
ncbi:Gfo/Idh/MocA family oxidoreductase [Sneathiella marina]|uniref:Gfo/Idh/MocA family oxidoreductase n=1 Tax=Sneathiella marina TaxID=2950108 RepID=A0ABY4W5Z0_9PROT|nr:Gfo/Idh/MocA family oxidoreductase [Sneathiella marina]USG62607.1 Gfo/Idh/MocA family oxidoreductase [Sneathiella marina]